MFAGALDCCVDCGQRDNAKLNATCLHVRIKTEKNTEEMQECCQKERQRQKKHHWINVPMARMRRWEEKPNETIRQEDVLAKVNDVVAPFGKK